ncbi:MAG TPA: lipase family protein [Candidatus Binatia bacterium]|nr:lipase family protein [Candidatus Binatia bacterium]
MIPFPPAITKAVIDESTELVKQAYLQYDRNKNGQQWDLSSSYDLFATLSACPLTVLNHHTRTEPFGFLVRNKNSNVLFAVFRGTRSLEDWVADFIVKSYHHPWGLVEDGFYRVYVQCGKLVRWLPAFGEKFSSKSIVVTGHSLGGALAILAASELSEMVAGKIDLSVVTFGGPRVGNPQFAKAFNQRVPSTLRIVNTEDLVPTLPPASTCFGTSRKRLRVTSSFWGHLAQHWGNDDFDYEHVGTILPFTQHAGSIPGNHSMDLYSSFTESLSL